MQLEGKAGFSISEACDAARISRAGFYRHFDDHAPQQSALNCATKFNRSA
jgi:hypothetical protein